MNNFINLNFQSAYNFQQEIAGDLEMVTMIQNNNYNFDSIMQWMRQYGLFRGINNENRNQIVQIAINTIPDIVNRVNINGEEDELNIRIAFENLLSAFHNSIHRKWVSATSKLLWCVYPNYFIIYDAFVKQAITAIQAFSETIYQLPRVGILRKNPDVEEQVSYYMRYQHLVRMLYQDYENIIIDLNEPNYGNYPYNIRIFDKLLWIIGNPNSNLFAP